MILPEWTITELNEKMESGELTSRQVTDLYLQRIAAVDKNGPYINSVIELNPDALEIADGLDNYMWKYSVIKSGNFLFFYTILVIRKASK